MARAPLKRFGSYALLSRLAKGGMGEVFIARHGELKGMQKLCVVKTLRADMSQDHEYSARFFDEARLVVQLSHRNICQVFDVGRVGERFYLGMELIGGVDLRALIDEARARLQGLPEPVALFIAGEMLEALSYAHRRTDPATGASLHIVHRDVSPQNVMVSFEGEVKLIDFGLAASTMKQERTQVNRVMGKLNYMSPEQARGGDVDARADIFAAAVVTYELLTGQRYYEGMSHDEVWNVAGRGTYRAPQLAKLHKGLARTLEAALAPNVDDRTPTALAFRDAIEAYLFARGFRPTPSDLRAYLSAHVHEQVGALQSLLGELAAVDDLEAPIEESRSLVRAPLAASTLATEPTQVRGPPVQNDDSEALSMTESDAQPKAVKPEARLQETAADVDARVRAIVPLHVSLDAATAVVHRAPHVTLVHATRSRHAPWAFVALAVFALVLIAGVTVSLMADDARDDDESAKAAVTAVPSDPPRVVAPVPTEPPPPVREDPIVDAGDSGRTTTTVKPSTTKKKRPTKRGPRAPARTASADVKLAFLKRHCVDVPCTATALSIRPRTTWTTQEKFRYDNILSSCVAMCTE